MSSETISVQAAADLLSSIAVNMRQNPAQFYSVHITVGEVSNKISGGHTAITAIGGSGQTTGAHFEARVSTDDILVAAGPALEEFQQRFLIAADVLNDIVDELRQVESDSRTIRSKLAKLTELAIPAVVVEITRQLIRSAGIAIT